MIIKFRLGDDLKDGSVVIIAVESMHDSEYDEFVGYEVEQISLDGLKAEYGAFKVDSKKIIAEYGRIIAEPNQVKKAVAKIHRFLNHGDMLISSRPVLINQFWLCSLVDVF